MQKNVLEISGGFDYVWKREKRKEIDEQFRKAEGIVSLEEIEKLGKIYSLGKAPLSIALGFGEVTITRYLADAAYKKAMFAIEKAGYNLSKP